MRDTASRRSRRKVAGDDRQTESRVNLYDEVTARIVSELEAGRLPWVQPWGVSGGTGPGLPRNALTARNYSGVNVLILWGAVIAHGWPSQSWLTFRQALEAGGSVRKLDSDYARAFAVSALWRITGIAQGWSHEPDADLLSADQEARRAVGLDPRDSLALALSAHLHVFLHHEFEIARVLFERAQAANPSCGFAWGYGALHKAYTGQIKEAWAYLERAQAILVHDPFLSFLESFRTVIAYFEHDWPLTIACARQQLRIRPCFTNMRKLLIGALCHLGEAEEARAEHAALIAQESDFRWQAHLAAYPFYDPAEREGLRAALAACGLCLRPTPLAKNGPRVRAIGPALPFQTQEL